MAAPNIVNVTTITAKTVLDADIAASEVDFLANGSSSGKVLKVNVLNIANIDGTNAATIKVGIKRSSTTHYIAFAINIPEASTLVVIGKDNGVYLEEGDTLTIEASAAGDLSAVCSYEEITDD
jgi:hypothetical protein|tara:strand:- start:37 stop:405 length:369 start_codon:yes stop_codon:yes gene_type:complete